MKAALKKLLYWLPAILFMTLIFYLSSRPAAGLIKSFPIFLGIKIVHIAEYGFLFFLVRSAVINTASLKPNRVFLLSFVITVLYGLSDEFHQALVPSRSASVLDVMANGIGAALVQLGIQIRSNRRS